MTFDRSGTADQQRRFLELTLSALQELERTATRPGYEPLFRIWDYNPPRQFRSWLIQVPERSASGPHPSLVLERTWDAAEDRDRLARDLRRRPRLHPTLRAREAELPPEDFAFLRGVASRLEFPLLSLRDAFTWVHPAQYGIEGFRRETVRLRSGRVRLEWSGNPPAELKAIASWATRTRELCERSFPSSDVVLQDAEPTGRCSLCHRSVLEHHCTCPACGAGYHQDCWEYVGRCAIYGCVGTADP